MAQLYVFLAKRLDCRDDDGHLHSEKVQLFLEWMLYTYHRMTTTATIKQVMHPNFLKVTAGLLQVNEAYQRLNKQTSHTGSRLLRF